MTSAADALTEVLAKIAEIEGRDGHEVPKIGKYLISMTPPDHFLGRERRMWEDHVVGAIVRAVKAHQNPENHLDDWMIDIEDGGDGSFIVFIKDRLGHKIAVGQGPLALAAARAYRDAIGGGDRG